jgi:DNA damage-binding protein 1
LVRSVLAATFADGVTNLFIGLGDGTLISYVLDGESSIVGMSRKSVSLGKRPITLARFKTAGDVSVFASTNRPTIVSRRSDRLNYLSVNLKVSHRFTFCLRFDCSRRIVLQDINAFTALNATAFPDSLALAFNDGIRIGRIDEIQRLHIRTLDLGREQPVRIAHDPAQKAFGVLCYREDFDRENGNRYSSSSFKILDDTSFERTPFTCLL